MGALCIDANRCESCTLSLCAEVLISCIIAVLGGVIGVGAFGSVVVELLLVVSENDFPVRSWMTAVRVDGGRDVPSKLC